MEWEDFEKEGGNDVLVCFLYTVMGGNIAFLSQHESFPLSRSGYSTVVKGNEERKVVQDS